MYGKYFTYNGASSQDYNLKLADLQHEMGRVTPLAMSRNVLRGELNRVNSTPHHMGTQWSDVLVFTIHFMKDICADGNDLYFNEDEVDDILAWLTSPDYPLLFHMYDYDFKKEVGYDSIYITGSGQTSDQVTFVHTIIEDREVEEEGEDGETIIIIVPTEVDVETTLTVDTATGTVTGGDYDFGLIVKDGYYMITADTEEAATWMQDFKELRVNDVVYSRAAETSSWNVDVKDGTVTNSYYLANKLEQFLNRKYDYFGLFTEVTPWMIGGAIAGFICTFTTNSPFAWTEEKTFIIDNPTGENADIQETIVVNHSERNREVYPIVYIDATEPPEGYVDPENRVDEDFPVPQTRMTIMIANLTDNQKGIRLSVLRHARTVIDSSRAMIYDQTGLIDWDDVFITDTNCVYFPKLYHGENRIYVRGAGTFTFKWREARKVGAY